MDNKELNNNTKLNKCYYCKKKCLILKYCKCEQIFCLKHLHFETHDCNYNYSDDKKLLKKVLTSKLEKI